MDILQRKHRALQATLLKAAREKRKTAYKETTNRTVTVTVIAKADADVCFQHARHCSVLPRVMWFT